MRGMIWESHGLFGGIWKWNIKIAPLRCATVFLWSAPSLHPPWKLWAVPAIPEGHGVLDLTLALCRPGVSAYGKLGKGCCISPSGFVKIKEISMLCQQEVSGQTGWGGCCRAEANGLCHSLSLGCCLLLIIDQPLPCLAGLALKSKQPHWTWGSTLCGLYPSVIIITTEINKRGDFTSETKVRV